MFFFLVFGFWFSFLFFVLFRCFFSNEMVRVASKSVFVFFSLTDLCPRETNTVAAAAVVVVADSLLLKVMLLFFIHVTRRDAPPKPVT